jgi:PAS domain S-box-containing protein
LSDNSYDQAHRAYDDSPERFRASHPEDRFSGSSGVLFEQAMAQTRMAICLCDPHQPDLPIIFANRAFRDLTGYGEEEVIGHNCRFLQGAETDPAAVAKLRTAIEKEQVCVVELLNYRKDGSKFWNALHLGPVYDSDNRLLYYFGSQWDVTDVRVTRARERYAREMARELSHRMKNMFAMIGGIVNLTARARGIEDEAHAINERIQALGRAYETTLDDAAKGAVEIGQAIRSVLEPYDMEGHRIRLLGNGLRTEFSVVSTLGLALHELAVNARQHGALATDGGMISVDWRREKVSSGEPMILIDWVEEGGPEMVLPGAPEAGSGFQIVDRLIAMSRGSIERDWRPEGLHAKVRLPLKEDV